jgi:hypothetical protein
LQIEALLSELMATLLSNGSVMASTTSRAQARWRGRHALRRQKMARASTLLQRQARSGEHLAELGELRPEFLDPKELAVLRGALEHPTAKETAAINCQHGEECPDGLSREPPG